jgi:excisionase family DNA binding protein
MDVDERLLRPGQVAALMGVDPKTVTRWANERRLRCIRTVGGHRRFSQAEVEALIAGSADDDGRYD